MSATDDKGKLSVTVHSGSAYFGYNVPLEIRDSSMRLVRRSSGERTFTLPAGLYQVSAVLEDGREHEQLVDVGAGGVAEVVLGVAPQSPASAPPADVQVRLRSRRARSFVEAPRFTPASEAVEEAVGAASGDLEVELEKVRGADVVRSSRLLWILQGGSQLDAVPSATVRIGSRRTVISLPTSAPGPTPTHCALRIDSSSGRPHATAWIVPERTVANALQNMLSAGQLLSASDMANEATSLLASKYEDPTGAVLGALILRKVGRLAPLQGWVENLARDFAWLADGKILLATLLASDHRDRAWELALAASRQRPLYADSYSILLDLLRRWPDKSRAARDQVVAALAERSPYIDWDSICFSHTTREKA